MKKSTDSKNQDIVLNIKKLSNLRESIFDKNFDPMLLQSAIYFEEIEIFDYLLEKNKVEKFKLLFKRLLTQDAYSYKLAKISNKINLWCKKTEIEDVFINLTHSQGQLKNLKTMGNRSANDLKNIINQADKYKLLANKYMFYLLQDDQNKTLNFQLAVNCFKKSIEELNKVSGKHPNYLDNYKTIMQYLLSLGKICISNGNISKEALNFLEIYKNGESKDEVKDLYQQCYFNLFDYSIENLDFGNAIKYIKKLHSEFIAPESTTDPLIITSTYYFWALAIKDSQPFLYKQFLLIARSYAKDSHMKEIVSKEIDISQKYGKNEFIVYDQSSYNEVEYKYESLKSKADILIYEIVKRENEKKTSFEILKFVEKILLEYPDLRRATYEPLQYKLFLHFYENGNYEEALESLDVISNMMLELTCENESVIRKSFGYFISVFVSDLFDNNFQFLSNLETILSKFTPTNNKDIGIRTVETILVFLGAYKDRLLEIDELNEIEEKSENQDEPLNKTVEKQDNSEQPGLSTILDNEFKVDNVETITENKPNNENSPKVKKKPLTFKEIDLLVSSGNIETIKDIKILNYYFSIKKKIALENRHKDFQEIQDITWLVDGKHFYAQQLIRHNFKGKDYYFTDNENKVILNKSQTIALKKGFAQNSKGKTGIKLFDNIMEIKTKDKESKDERIFTKQAFVTKINNNKESLIIFDLKGNHKDVKTHWQQNTTLEEIPASFTDNSSDSVLLHGEGDGSDF